MNISDLHSFEGDIVFVRYTSYLRFNLQLFCSDSIDDFLVKRFLLSNKILFFFFQFFQNIVERGQNKDKKIVQVFIKILSWKLNLKAMINHFNDSAFRLLWSLREFLFDTF